MWFERSARRARRLACAISCVFLAAPVSAQAFAVKETASGQSLHWVSTSVPFLIDPSVASLGPGASLAVGSAMAAWSGADGAPSLTVTPAESASKPSFDGSNVVYFAPEGFAPAGDALAVTILTYEDATGSILDADIVLNGIYRFRVLPEGALPPPDAPMISNDTPAQGSRWGRAEVGTFDILHVAAHESGHSLGMADETEKETSLMYLYSRPGDARRRAPTSDDLAGIHELYADAAGEHGCSSSTLSPKRARSSALVFVVWVLGFGVAMLRWRTRGVGARPTASLSRGVGSALFILAGALPIAGVMPASHASASVSAAGLAHARVAATRPLDGEGPWRTELSLSLVECGVAPCSTQATVQVWGGRRGTLVQQVGEAVPPKVGDEILVETRTDGTFAAIRSR